MKTRGRALIALFMIGIFFCVLVPNTNAENYDIGEKVSRSDLHQTWYSYSSGSYLGIDSCSDDRKYENITAMFDGNISTGVHETSFSSGYEIFLFFPHSLYVNNITLLPNYDGGATEYNVQLIFGDRKETLFSGYRNTMHFANINYYIDGLELHWNIPGTDFYFNDVIINYAPSQNDICDCQDHDPLLQQEIDNLTLDVSDLTNELESSETQIFDLGSEIITLKDDVNELSAKIENLTKENIAFNDEMNNLNAEIENLTKEKTALNNEIEQMYKENMAFNDEMINLTAEIKNIEEIQEEQRNSFDFGGMLIGVLIALVAVETIVLVSRRSGGLIQQAGKKNAEDLDPFEKKTDKEDSDI